MGAGMRRACLATTSRSNKRLKAESDASLNCEFLEMNPAPARSMSSYIEGITLCCASSSPVHCVLTCWAGEGEYAPTHSPREGGRRCLCRCCERPLCARVCLSPSHVRPIFQRNATERGKNRWLPEESKCDSYCGRQGRLDSGTRNALRRNSIGGPRSGMGITVPTLSERLVEQLWSAGVRMSSSREEIKLLWSRSSLFPGK